MKWSILSGFLEIRLKIIHSTLSTSWLMCAHTVRYELLMLHMIKTLYIFTTAVNCSLQHNRREKRKLRQNLSRVPVTGQLYVEVEGFFAFAGRWLQVVPEMWLSLMFDSPTATRTTRFCCGFGKVPGLSAILKWQIYLIACKSLQRKSLW